MVSHIIHREAVWKMVILALDLVDDHEDPTKMAGKKCKYIYFFLIFEICFHKHFQRNNVTVKGK